MTKAERKVMAKVYACVNRMSGMQPTNPADLPAKAKCNELQCQCSSLLVCALSSLNFKDLALANEHADNAMQTLGLPK